MVGFLRGVGTTVDQGFAGLVSRWGEWILFLDPKSERERRERSERGLMEQRVQ